MPNKLFFAYGRSSDSEAFLIPIKHAGQAYMMLVNRDGQAISKAQPDTFGKQGLDGVHVEGQTVHYPKGSLNMETGVVIDSPSGYARVESYLDSLKHKYAMAPDRDDAEATKYMFEGRRHLKGVDGDLDLDNNTLVYKFKGKRFMAPDKEVEGAIIKDGDNHVFYGEETMRYMEGDKVRWEVPQAENADYMYDAKVSEDQIVLVGRYGFRRCIDKKTGKMVDFSMEMHQGGPPYLNRLTIIGSEAIYDGFDRGEGVYVTDLDPSKPRIPAKYPARARCEVSKDWNQMLSGSRVPALENTETITTLANMGKAAIAAVLVKHADNDALKKLRDAHGYSYVATDLNKLNAALVARGAKSMIVPNNWMMARPITQSSGPEL